MKDPRSPFFARIGAWLFKNRSWLPVPLVAMLLYAAPAERLPSPLFWLIGGTLVAAGEVLRLWAVHHIGVISRTRSERLGPLIATGPFSLVRNPLYLGNILLWVGFAVTAGIVWLVPLVLIVLGLEYHAIVRWEEELLTARLGDSYREYTERVPRWRPAITRLAQPPHTAPFSWNETLFSERGTLIAIALGYLLLWLKVRF